MDNSQEQETGRQRMRELFQQRDAERGSLKHKQPIFKSAEQQMQLQKQKQKQLLLQQEGGVVWTPNAVARKIRQPTASRGQYPIFDEHIWDEDRRPQRANQDRSVSPKTRVAKDDDQIRACTSNGNSSSNGNSNMKTTSGTRLQERRKHGTDKDTPYDTITSNRKKPS
ncbi:hypothetical protein G647_09185 [Cladophialophora carrionii CBS 160.54]|uniref:Uncharacterized protein n=1 Tax=Cladophialophora carrionii CBS 160.54 TaxID=1279043 RepID=V9CZA2_9EURO|nr:uncharacterized protein G647_09185 [Cladophialophora carrionii CBS 160.54]ETI19353.1 hypothetical protein G647_09185 [Cladophialophora carrionii CBS 160.54]